MSPPSTPEVSTPLYNAESSNTMHVYDMIQSESSSAIHVYDVTQVEPSNTIHVYDIFKVTIYLIIFIFPDLIQVESVYVYRLAGWALILT